MARATADLVLRRHSAAILAVVLVLGVAVPPGTPVLVPAGLLIYGVARYRAPISAAAGVLAAAAATAAHGLLWEDAAGVGATLSTGLVCAVVAVFGWTRAQHDRAMARERELLAETAAADERLRIARELHDAVGHDVSLMVVQAQALAATVVGAEAQATAIAALGRHTMGELHRTVRLLREDADHAPEPGLAALPEVIDGARAAGVAVTFAIEGAPRELEPALDRSAFRIAQEALTNTVRHAAGAAAALTVRYGEDALELLLDDDGPGPAPEGFPGHGLIGMRERTALFGGTLETGAGERGGYRVHATLPYAASA